LPGDIYSLSLAPIPWMASVDLALQPANHRISVLDQMVIDRFLEQRVTHCNPFPV